MKTKGKSVELGSRETQERLSSEVTCTSNGRLYKVYSLESLNTLADESMDDWKFPSHNHKVE